MGRETWRGARGAWAAAVGLVLAVTGSSPGPARAAPPPRLAPCPASPNCVSSQATDGPHRVEPIPFSGEASRAVARMRAVVEREKRARVVRSDETSLRAEFTSALFRFVDDVDVVADPDRSVLEIRSASRVGTSDLGVNRRRVERLRAAFSREETAPHP